MIDNNEERELYYGLVKHNTIQHAVFISSFIVLLVSIFLVSLPIIQTLIIEDYLNGKVNNDGEPISYNLEDKKNKEPTNYYNKWAIDVFLDTPSEARYWLDPIVSLLMPISLLSFLITLIISSLLPTNIGLIRHKVEREIINQLDKIHYSNFGFYSDSKNEELEKDIQKADDRKLHSLAEVWKINKEEIKYLSKAINWKNESFFYKLLHPFNGLEFYLRFYFTERYGNTMLGLVYIGAAVLIIIIGMRGLKFIPSTQPSLVFFALGLEFSVLIAYAVTVMFSKNDSDSEYDVKLQKNNDAELKNSKEVENLLRAFLKKPNKKDK